MYVCMYVHTYTVEWENFVVKSILYTPIFTKLKLMKDFSNIVIILVKTAL